VNPQLLFDLFPELTPIQKNQFEQLGHLYADWNSKINLISRKDIDLLYERHIIHSLAIAKFISFQNGTSVLDIGTGGGFPAIPLAIFFPETKFFAVDSIAKKIKVVAAIAESLELTNIEPICIRAEQFTGKVDFVVSRATAHLPDLVKWSAGKILKEQKNAIPNGIICLKGGDLTEETAPYRKKVHIESVTDYLKMADFESKYVVYLPL
jgi:16S rRNA (guanine527-N7)-methyltransferase